MKVRGPLVTLSTVAVLGAGILLVNISQEQVSVVPGTPVAAPATTTVTVPPAAPAPSFPAKADYVGKIPTAKGVITLDIAVEVDVGDRMLRVRAADDDIVAGAPRQ